MTPFHKYVIGISILVLIITILSILFINFFTPRSKVRNVFQNTCPNGWNINVNNTCDVPSGKVWDGSLNGSVKDSCPSGKKCTPSLDLSFTNPEWNKFYSGDTLHCAQSRWANKNGLTWEGVTNLGSAACT